MILHSGSCTQLPRTLVSRRTRTEHARRAVGWPQSGHAHTGTKQNKSFRWRYHRQCWLVSFVVVVSDFKTSKKSDLNAKDNRCQQNCLCSWMFGPTSTSSQRMEDVVDLWSSAVDEGELQVRLPVQCSGEGHIVQGALYCVHSGVRLHPLDAVLSLVWG